MPASNRFAVALAAAIVVMGAFVLLRDAETSEVARGADVAVSCGVSQRAVVRQTVTSDTPHVDIQCVDGPAAQAASYVVDQRGQVRAVNENSYPIGLPSPEAAPSSAPASIGYAPAVPVAPQAVPLPAVYQTVRHVPVVQPVSAAPASASGPTRAVRQPESTWKKRALVIGGSAGAGAGVGALVGGKKGALIGAAIGGGGAALFEALKD